MLIILAQAAIAGGPSQPSQRSLHDPPPRLDDESLLIRGLPHDLQIDLEEIMDESDEVSAIRVIRPDLQSRAEAMQCSQEQPWTPCTAFLI